MRRDVRARQQGADHDHLSVAAPTARRSDRAVGIAFVVVSAVSFGTLGVLGLLGAVMLRVFIPRYVPRRR